MCSGIYWRYIANKVDDKPFFLYKFNGINIILSSLLYLETLRKQNMTKNKKKTKKFDLANFLKIYHKLR